MNAARELFVCVKCTTDASFPLGDADAAALEQALEMRDRGEVECITCVTAGPPAAVEVLAWALAMGVDRAVHIDLVDDALLDERATGALLACAIGHLGGQLVFTGQRSDDGQSGIVPASLARALGGAYLSDAVAARLDGERVDIHRKLERGRRQQWAAALPAVVAFDPLLEAPRYVAVAARILARRRDVETSTPEAIGVELSGLPRLTAVRRMLPYRVRPKKVGSVRSSQSVSERMSAIVSGGTTEATTRSVLRGDPEELAAAVVKFLKEHRILARGATPIP